MKTLGALVAMLLCLSGAAQAGNLFDKLDRMDMPAKEQPRKESPQAASPKKGVEPNIDLDEIFQDSKKPVPTSGAPKAASGSRQDMPAQGKVKFALTRLEPTHNAGCEAQFRVFSANDSADLELDVYALDDEAKTIKSKKMKLVLEQPSPGDTHSVVFPDTFCLTVERVQLRPLNKASCIINNRRYDYCENAIITESLGTKFDFCELCM